MNPDPNGIRPIEAADTLFIEDMTWMEVRDAMKSGKETVLIATGGIEQNGPYLVAGKHNVVWERYFLCVSSPGDKSIRRVMPLT